MSKEIKRRSRSMYPAEFDPAMAVWGIYCEQARAGRRVTKPYAQSIHGGQGGTPGEVP